MVTPMGKIVVMVMLCCPIVGCGGGSTASKPSMPPPVSEWTGTYTGILNFKGCPSANPCGGDSITLVLTESLSFSDPGEFSPIVDVGGADSTTSKPIVGSGTALYYGAAPIGPGSSQATLAITTTVGNFYLTGSGSATTKIPVVLDSLTVNSIQKQGSVNTKGDVYFGALTRE